MKTSALVLLTLSCHYALAQNSSRKFNVSAYQNIQISKALSANIEPGACALTASGLEKDLDQLVVEVKDNTLYVNIKKDLLKKNKNIKEIKLNIQLPNPNKIELNQASKAYFSGFGKLQQLSLLLDQASQFKGDLTLDQLNLECHSASSFTAKLNAQQFNINLSGASKAYVSGLSKQLEAKLTQASSLDAQTLEVSDAILDASMASNANIWATKKLNVKASQASSVFYQGDAKLSSDVSQASVVNKK